MMSWSEMFDPLYSSNEEAGIINPEARTEQFSWSDTGRLRLEKVNIPGYAVCKPPTINDSTKAILILPGGAYSRLAIDHEGWAVAQWLAGHGHVGIVLKYRLPDPVLMTHPELQPLNDALKGIEILKEVCTSMNIPLNSGGLLGFSAGGHLAAWALHEYLHRNQVDPEVNFPGFQILAYPVITMHGEHVHQGSRNQLLKGKAGTEMERNLSIHLKVNARTPPTFIIHAMDDAIVHFHNSQLMTEACMQAGVSVKTMWVSKGGHGFGLYQEQENITWLDSALSWLHTMTNV